MEYKWLNKNNNNKLIVFFNGWGMDENIVKHLNPENYDVLMFNDYNSLNTSFDFENLGLYLEKYLIAWSMGVMCATLFKDVGYNKKIAINGTLKPIDSNYGINPRIYDLTIKNFNQNSCKQFVQNMFQEEVNDIYIKRDFENIHKELIALKNYSSNFNFKYDKVYISDNDKIISTKNQVAFWGTESNIRSGHYPFFEFAKWSELI